MMNQIYPLCCAALLCSVSILRAEPQTNAAPRAALPLLRANYIIGESLPVALRGSAAKRRVELRDAAGKVAVSWTGTAQALRLDTARLTAGEYELWVDGQPSGVKFGLVSPIRSSSAALCDEARPDASTVEHSSGTQRVLRETGINALMEVGLGGIGRDAVNDVAATTGALLFYNPYNRAMSFFPARVEAGELKTFRHRLALAAQANGRYPTFGGFYYDWDPTAFLNRMMLPFYYGWEGQEKDRPVTIEPWGASGVRIVTNDYEDLVFLGDTWLSEKTDAVQFAGHAGWIRRESSGQVRACVPDGDQISAFGVTITGRGPWTYNLDGSGRVALCGGPPRAVRVQI